MPTDEEIIIQQNEIQEEIVKTQPLVSPSLPFELLREEAKLSMIPEELSVEGLTFRKIRGDGNCFFRSFVFGLIERVFKHSALNNLAVRKQVSLINERIIKLLRGADMQSMIYEDFLEDWKSTIDRLLLPVFPLDVGDRLEELWRMDEMLSHSTIMLFRLTTSAFLLQNWDKYMPFLEGVTGDRRSFCSRWAECMGVESDQIHATCLSMAIGIPITIFSIEHKHVLPTSISPTNPLFPSDPSTTLCLLYRPGHYDFLCK